MKALAPLVATLLALAPPAARADDAAPPPTEGASAPAGAPSAASSRGPAPPYSLPWQLRPIIAPTVLRAETTAALYEGVPGGAGVTFATLLTGSYRIEGTGPKGAGLAPLVRLTLVGDAPPGGGAGGVSLVNPLVGAAYALKLEGGFRLNAFLGVTVPIGMGGGDAPDAGPLAARSKGPNARLQLDNALFAVNDFTVIPGFGAAYVKDGLTVQVEVTLLQLLRVRGATAQPDAAKTNFTTGLHVGYFILPMLSVGGELRYQRWLAPPGAVSADATGDSHDAVSVALGPRLHVPLGGGVWIRPGLAYARALDRPLGGPANYHHLTADVPVLF